jgi:two-component system, cell cycle sensor histidine kinase and response regulator CckA
MTDSKQKKRGRRAKPAHRREAEAAKHAPARSYREVVESEQRYKQLSELACDWFWETDTDGRLTYMSSNVEVIIGLPIASYLGKRLAETEGIAYDPEAGRATLVAFKARRAYRDFIYSRKRRDGGVAWISTSGGPFYAEDGRFLGYRGVARDVTSKVEAERRLKNVEQQHRRLFEASSDWYWEQDGDGRLTYVSPSFENATGVPAEKMLGRRLSDVSQVQIDPESGMKTLAAIKNRVPYRDLVHAATLDDGRLVHVVTSGIPIYDENGEFRGYCGVSKEITAQVKAEHALREGEQRFRELFEIASDYYWDTDADKRITYVSENYEKVFGIPRSEVMGKRLTDVPGVSVGPEMGKMVFAALKARRPYRDFVYSRQLPDGKTRWYKISAVPIFGADGTFHGYRGVGGDMTAHVEADQAARLAQSRLHDAVAHVTQPFVFYDAHHHATAFNQAFTDLHREPGGTLPITPAVSFRALAEWQLRVGFYATGPSEPGITLDDLMERYESGGEHTYHLRDGRWMLVVYRGLPGGGRVGLWTDVTAIKRAEQALRDSEQRFKELFEIGSDYFWEADAHQRMVYLSENYESVFGIPRSETLGKRLTETSGVSIDPEMGKMVITAIKARRPYRDFLYSRKFPNGKIRWFKTSAIPVFAADGNFDGYRGVGADLTVHVEAEQAGRLAQARLQDAVVHVTQPFVFYDAEHRATGFNQAFTDLHREPGGTAVVGQGISFMELAEWQVRVGFYAEGADEEAITFDALRERYENGREHAYHLRDGRWMLVTYRRLPGGGRVGLWTDVTEIKRGEVQRRMLELQLHHSQRLEALGTLAGGVAHEINNALVPVVALTKMVIGKMPDGSRERRNLDTVLIGAERSRDLVKQILAFSRKEEEPQQHSSIDLADILRDALGMMRASLPTTIQINGAVASAPRIRGDRSQLHQVVINLMTNAAQAIGEAQGTITLRLASNPGGAEVRLSIIDTGCGMDEATKARIFEPFFTTKGVGQGTGLGLAVVHGIVTEHGGRIEVDSVPGRGTGFHIILPIEAAKAGAAA